VWLWTVGNERMKKKCKFQKFSFWNMQGETCSVKHAMWNMQRETCSVKHAAWNMQCETLQGAPSSFAEDLSLLGYDTVIDFWCKEIWYLYLEGSTSPGWIILDCSTLKMKEVQSFKTSGTTHPVRLFHIPENFNLLPKACLYRVL